MKKEKKEREAFHVKFYQDKHLVLEITLLETHEHQSVATRNIIHSKTFRAYGSDFETGHIPREGGIPNPSCALALSTSACNPSLGCFFLTNLYHLR
jgi:hypothetical protein